MSKNGIQRVIVKSDEADFGFNLKIYNGEGMSVELTSEQCERIIDRGYALTPNKTVWQCDDTLIVVDSFDCSEQPLLFLAHSAETLEAILSQGKEANK